MDAALMSRVGLQLLLEPQATAHIFRGACVVVGCLYPSYASYKAIVEARRAASAGGGAGGQPAASTSGRGSSSSLASVHALAAERWLKYWALFGATVAVERLVGRHLDAALPWSPHLKLAWLLWLQSNGGHGASLLFERRLAPWLARYERKLDALLEAGARLAAGLRSSYAGPLGQLGHSATLALTHLASFLTWLTTPDDAPPPVHARGDGGGGGGGSRDSKQGQPQRLCD